MPVAAVLLAHGAGGDMDSGLLPRLAAALAADCRTAVVRFTCRLPHLATRVAAAEAVLRAAAGWAETAGLRTWVLAGHSMGGRVACEVAHRSLSQRRGGAGGGLADTGGGSGGTGGAVRAVGAEGAQRGRGGGEPGLSGSCAPAAGDPAAGALTGREPGAMEGAGRPGPDAVTSRGAQPSRNAGVGASGAGGLGEAAEAGREEVGTAGPAHGAQEGGESGEGSRGGRRGGGRRPRAVPARGGAKHAKQGGKRRRGRDEGDMAREAEEKEEEEEQEGEEGAGGGGGATSKGRLARERSAAAGAAEPGGGGARLPRVAGCVLLSYPLHPPGKEAQLRDAPLAALPLPLLFVRGGRDPFCAEGPWGALRARLASGNAEVHDVPAGDHGLVLAGGGRGVERAAAQEAAVAGAVQAVVAFVQALLAEGKEDAEEGGIAGPSAELGPYKAGEAPRAVDRW